MATHAGRLTQDQNFNVHYDGAPVGVKTNGLKAQKKGGALAVRKALNDISNSGKPSALQASRKHNSMHVIPIGEDLGVFKTTSFPVGGRSNVLKPSEKAQVGGRKALGDLTNSCKPLGQQVSKKKSRDKKLVVAEEENLPNSIAEERFLHNHQDCIKAQREARDMEYFLKTIGLDDDISEQSVSPCRSVSRKSKDESPVKILEMEELSELMIEDKSIRCNKIELLSGQSSRICESPKSPKPPYMHWKDQDFSNFMLTETPKLPKC